MFTKIRLDILNYHGHRIQGVPVTCRSKLASGILLNLICDSGVIANLIHKGGNHVGMAGGGAGGGLEKCPYYNISPIK